MSIGVASNRRGGMDMWKRKDVLTRVNFKIYRNPMKQIADRDAALGAIGFINKWKDSLGGYSREELQALRIFIKSHYIEVDFSPMAAYIAVMLGFGVILYHPYISNQPIRSWKQVMEIAIPLIGVLSVYVMAAVYMSSFRRSNYLAGMLLEIIEELIKV